ncbi:hypothetical protein BDZ97DRAFT_1675230, partial [Flammula alnicola]
MANFAPDDMYMGDDIYMDIDEPGLSDPGTMAQSPPLPATTASGRPRRNYALPARYRDVYPEGPIPIVQPPTEPAPLIQRVILIVRNPLSTLANVFGMWKKYLYRPSYDPDACLLPEDLYRPHDMNSLPSNPPRESVHQAEETENASSDCDLEEPSVYRNKTVEMVMDWQNTGSSQKSDLEVNRLINEVIFHPDFNVEELKHFNAQRENQRADAADQKSPLLRSFKEASVDIEVPSGSKHVPSKKFSIPGLHYR